MKGFKMTKARYHHLLRRLLCLLVTIALLSLSCRADEIKPALKSEQRMCEVLRNHTLQETSPESDQMTGSSGSGGSMTCTLQHVLQEGTEWYDEATWMYHYESPIYVDLPVTLKKLSVVASIRARDFATSHVELSAKPSLFTKEIITGDHHHQQQNQSQPQVQSHHDIVLKSGPAGGILARVATSNNHEEEEEGEWLRTAWTSQRNNQVLKFNKDLQRALEFLHPSSRRSSGKYNQVLNNTSSSSRSNHIEEEEEEQQSQHSLHSFLRSSSDFHAGQGGALGTWTLHIQSREPSAVKDWSMEMCFDAKANFDALCTSGMKNNTEEMRVEAMGRGRRRGVPQAFAQTSSSGSGSGSGFCLPGFRFYCNMRANRMRDQMKCVEEGYSLNPFRRVQRRYCCATSRIFFLRRWWRKNLTGTCRRFFRN
jgi:hypothetical protein